MNPKIQEVCEITYAMWDNENEKFVVPANEPGLNGAFNVDWEYNENYGDVSEILSTSDVYRFLAVVQRHESNQNVTLKADGQADNYLVYPLNLQGGEKSQNIVTSITALFGDANSQVKNVVYYNLMGIPSSTPFNGVNIVVKEMLDGSKVTTKIIIK
jgi:hypothetical protein